MNTDTGTQAARPTILAVDDDPAVLGVLGELLQPHYNVLAAPSGERALQVVTGTPRPDLILLDLMMPVLDGYATMAQLLDNPATRDIPIIIVTGLDSADAEEKGLELGAVDYITKPFRPSVVLARVHAQLELKRSRDALREQNVYLEAEVARREATLHSVTFAARDAIIMIDDADRIAFWNPAAETMFGHAATEVLGQELHALLTPPRFRDAAAQGLAEFRHSGTGGAVGKTVELAALRKGGAEFPIEMSLSSIRREDSWWGVAIVRDITGRKALAAKLAQAQSHLLQADKLAAIGQLAAGVAHEINNPIGFVSSNMGSLANYVSDILEILDAFEAAATNGATLAAAQTLKQQKDLDYLRTDILQLIAESQDGLGRVRQIVQDLKGFAHAEDNKWQWADLRSVMESTLNIVWNELKYHCTVHKAYDDLPKVWCLPSQLGQVFMNLLVNAGQAISGKGDITLRSGRQGDEVFFAIADTGSGITPENLHKLFDPFFTTKPVGKGTGLGLSLSFAIVEKHHGRIEVLSEVGQGSTFTVWLPINGGDTAVDASGHLRPDGLRVPPDELAREQGIAAP